MSATQKNFFTIFHNRGIPFRWIFSQPFLTHGCDKKWKKCKNEKKFVAETAPNRCIFPQKNDYPKKGEILQFFVFSQVKMGLVVLKCTWKWKFANDLTSTYHKKILVHFGPTDFSREGGGNLFFFLGVDMEISSFFRGMRICAYRCKKSCPK